MICVKLYVIDNQLFVLDKIFFLASGTPIGLY